jgi:methylmalonyl-CoA mutase
LAWQALVEKTLKGASAQSLDISGPDGLTIRPLYERSSAPRGFATAPRPTEQSWDIRARLRHPSLAASHDAALDELAGGASSLVLAIRQMRADGIAAASSGDMAEVLEGVLFDVAPVALDAGWLGPAASDWLSSAVKGSPAAPLALHLDPLSAFARDGASEGPIESHIIAAAESAARLAAVHPRASLFLASGAVVHEAGGGPAEELAFALASALAYLKAAVDTGMALDLAASRVALGLAVDADPYLSIAKLRAARMVWARLTSSCGVRTSAIIEARSSLRMLARAEPWTNMVRLTAACLAGAVGGADAIVLSPFTDVLGLPTPFARRMARNTQLVLMEEARLGAVADPVGGSGAFEALSSEVARAAWARFNAVEAAGGIVAALREGQIAREVEVGRAAIRDALASGAAKIVGVTDFRSDEIRPASVEAKPEVNTPPPSTRLPGADSHCPPLVPVTLEDLAA